MSKKTDYTKQLLTFIEESPSCFHVIHNLKEMLLEQGFTEVSEKDSWKMEAGKGYFVTRNDSSIIAFRLPKTKEIKGFHMMASHSDSPTFKVKEAPEMGVEEHYVKLNTEGYGGMIRSSWVDRPLSVAGRVAYSDGKEIHTKLVNVDKDLCVIPNLAIHMNREINKGFEYQLQTDMLPLFGSGKATLLEEIAKESGLKKEDILGHDLFLYLREKGRVLGAKGEYILSPKLDDLQCAYTTMRAFADTKPEEYINLCAVFDNEEVGSGTRQGADSSFLEDTMRNIVEGVGETDGLLRRLIAGSLLISADNAHAVHPNHPEKADPTNRPFLNGGIVIKYHGGQKYTTDAGTTAKMKDICNRAKVPFQTFANRSDSPGGSTLGNISTAHISVASVDIGLPQLAMHSAMETGGSKDTEYAIKAFEVFFTE